MLKKALQFSGGKDSLACLYLLEPIWNELLVVWGNTGAAYQETIELMEKVKNLVPHFQEVKSDQPSYIESYGFPSDVLAIRNTNFGHIVHGTEGRKFTDYLSCCNANIWQPLAKACEGMEVIYRGQRSEDEKKGPVKSGDVINGIQYIFPIENWSTEQVKKYLGEKLPEYYSQEKSSHDCWSCTAYLEDNLERISKLPNEKKEYVESVLIDMRDAIKQDLNQLDEVINGIHY